MKKFNPLRGEDREMGRYLKDEYRFNPPAINMVKSNWPSASGAILFSGETVGGFSHSSAPKSERRPGMVNVSVSTLSDHTKSVSYKDAAKWRRPRAKRV